MAVDSIQVNQSVQTEGCSLKRATGNCKGEEELFEEFFSSLLQQIKNTSDPKDEDCSVSSEQQLNQLLSCVDSSAYQNNVLPDTAFIKAPLIKKGPGEVSVVMKNVMPLTNNDSGLTIEKLSDEAIPDYALKALEEMKLNTPHTVIQSLTENIPHETKAQQGIEALKSFLKQYASIDGNAEVNNGENMDDNSSIKDEKTPTIGKANDAKVFIPQQKKENADSKASNGSNEQNLLNDSIPDPKIQSSTEKTPAAIFKEPDISNEGINSNIQAAPSEETSQVLAKPSELSQENIDKIAKSFKTLRLPDSTELSVKLTPEELGEVTVRVVLEKGHITGHITAESKDIALMLQNKLDLLKQEIVHKNVNLSDISVSVFTGQGDGNSRHSSREFLNKHGHRLGSPQGYVEETANINDDEHDTGLNIIA
jgi:flagellar hook-length control protein FliK